MRASNFLVALAIGMFVGAPLAQAEDGIVVVQVWGQADESLDDARTRALDDAFGQAVRQVSAARVPPRLSASRRRALNDGVYRRARRFVLSYRVETQENRGGKLRVRARIKINRSRLDEVLDDIGMTESGDQEPEPSTPASPRPRVVVVGSIASGAASVTSVQAAAVVAAGEVGLDVVSSRGKESVGDDAAALDVARDAGAGGAVRYAIESHPQGAVRGTSLFGATATASVYVLEKGESRPIAELRVTAASFAGSDAGAQSRAAAEALQRALRTLKSHLDQRWPVPRSRKAGIAVSIVGAKSSATLDAIERRAVASSGKVKIIGRRMGHGIVTWTVESALSASQLAALLRSAPIASGSISASARSNREVEVRVRDYGGGA